MSTKPTPKTGPTPVASFPKFDTGNFEMPKFDMPKFEVPAAFRDLAEKSVAQARDGYAQVKAAAEETTEVLEETYSTASKGYTDYSLKVLEAARMNANSTFDYLGKLMTMKSLSEAVELSSAHARKQFETVTAQSKELGALAQKVATETAAPMKAGMTKAFSKAA